MDHIFGTKEVGSRYATRVLVVSTDEQPTSFAGSRGIVVRALDEGNIFVRLTSRGREVTLPFGRSNLQVLR